MILELNLSNKQLKKHNLNSGSKQRVISNKSLLFVLDIEDKHVRAVFNYFGFPYNSHGNGFTIDSHHMYILNDPKAIFNDAIIYIVSFAYLNEKYKESIDFALRHVAHIIFIVDAARVNHIDVEFLNFGPKDNLYKVYSLTMNHNSLPTIFSSSTKVFKDNPRIIHHKDLNLKFENGTIGKHEKLDWLINSIDLELLKRDSSNMVIDSLYFCYLEITWDHHCIAFSSQEDYSNKEYENHNAHIYNCLMTRFRHELTESFMDEMRIIYKDYLKGKELEAVSKFVDQSNLYMQSLKRIYGQLSVYSDIELIFGEYIDKLAFNFIWDRIAHFKETFAAELLKLIEKNIKMGMSTSLSLENEISGRFMDIDSHIALIPMKYFQEVDSHLELWKKWQVECYKNLYFELLTQNLQKDFIATQVNAFKETMLYHLNQSSEPLWKHVNSVIDKFNDEFHGQFYDLKHITNLSDEGYEKLKEHTLAELLIALRTSLIEFIHNNLENLVSRLVGNEEKNQKLISDFLQNLNLLFKYEHLEDPSSVFLMQNASVFTEKEFVDISDRVIKHYVKEKSLNEQKRKKRKNASYTQLGNSIAKAMKKQLHKHLKVHFYHDKRITVLILLIAITVGYFLYSN